MSPTNLISAEGPLPTREAYRRQRVYECIPALLLVLTVPIPFLLWWISPRAAYVVLCGYLVYLAYMSIDLAGRQVIEFLTMRRVQRVDWPARLSALADPYPRLAELDRLPRLSKSEREERAALVARLAETDALDPAQLWQLVVVPVANEGSAVLTPTLEALASSRYRLDRLVVCVSFEARCRHWTDEAIERLTAPYRDRFGMLLTLRHPDGLAGEARVKGANLTWAARQAREALHAAGIRDEQVVVSALDCDTRVDVDYFGVLGWTFLTNPHRDVDAYQPILLFHNNVWQVPVVSRLVGHLASMWSMGDATRRGRMQIFSSHAAGMQALVRVDFWAINIVPDDSRQYWRLYYGTEGRSRTRPLHIPVYLDAVQGRGYVRTLVEQYLQLRRWSYGVIDFAYIMTQNVAHPRIPLSMRLVQTFRQLSSFHKRAITPVLLFIVGQIITALNKRGVPLGSHMILATGRVQSWTWVVGLVSLAIGMVVSLALLPVRPRGHSLRARLRLGAEWLLLPVVLPVFISLPALDVHLRLVVRRYLGFRVTVKEHATPRAALVLRDHVFLRDQTSLTDHGLFQQHAFVREQAFLQEQAASVTRSVAPARVGSSGQGPQA